jgi:8-oxo-dGTP diphosphatase
LKSFCIAIMRHRIRAAALIVRNTEILLVCHRTPGTQTTWWIPPGGGLEGFDASIFACASREVFEETGLRASCSRIAYIREFIETSRQIRHLELFVVADEFSGDITLANLPAAGADFELIQESRWIAKNDLSGLTVYPEIIHRSEFWDDYAAGFPAPKYLGCQQEGLP